MVPRKMVPGRHFGITTTELGHSNLSDVMPKCRPGTIFLGTIFLVFPISAQDPLPLGINLVRIRTRDVAPES